MFATGSRPGEVAEALGVDPTTISRWRAQEGVRARVAALRAELVEATIGAATDVASRALQEAVMATSQIEDPAKAARIWVELWKATSGRVGLPEHTTSSVTVEPAPTWMDAVRELVEQHGPDGAIEALDEIAGD